MAEVERQWKQKSVDADRVAELRASTNMSERAARLLVRRGVQDAEGARRYLEPSLADLHDPSSMKDLDRAAERLADAIEQKQPITLYGDYDVDGVTSTTLLATFLRHHGIQAEVYIPKRLVEGYGLNAEAVEHIASLGTKVLVTLDCGITASEEIGRANERGIDCIVVDHHRCPPELPPAFATLNPQQDDCRFPEQILAAVGVCFHLVMGLRRVLRERGHYGPEGTWDEPHLRRYLDLVALGTICDMVPLKGVNRVLTWFGMAELRWAQRPGIRALMEVSKVRPREVDSGDIGYKLGPRINAAGRLHDAKVGVTMLMADDINVARKHAATLDVANGNRRDIESHVFHAAVEAIDTASSVPDAIVLVNEDWHPGVVGIVASKLVERYDRPTVLIGEGGRGSGRTARGVHLYNALNACSGHLTKFGGHRAAAGLRIPFGNVEQFRTDLIQMVVKDPEFANHGEPTLHYDDELSPDEIDDACFKEIQQLEPFGMGNPEPLFRMKNVRLKMKRVVGGEHLKFRLQEGRFGGLPAIAFKKGEMADQLEVGAPLDLACHVEVNEFQGLYNLELRVRDLRLDQESAEVPF